VLSVVRRDRLVLILPPNPAFARLARMAALHFLRLQGVQGLLARRGARTVESRSRTALKAAARRSDPTRGLSLTCIAGARALEVLAQGGQSARRSLLVMPRPVAEEK
jgi:hypothetical protein